LRGQLAVVWLGLAGLLLGATVAALTAHHPTEFVQQGNGPHAGGAPQQVIQLQPTALPRGAQPAQRNAAATASAAPATSTPQPQAGGGAPSSAATAGASTPTPLATSGPCRFVSVSGSCVVPTP